MTRYYPLFDQLGSTVALTDSAGAVAARYVYEDPFGDNPVVSGTASTPVRFTGGYRDPETGFYKFGERYYMPEQGRWTQRDPLNQAFSPREANRYAYAGADPVNLTDPTGRDIFDVEFDVSFTEDVLPAWGLFETARFTAASGAIATFGTAACVAGTAGAASWACAGIAATAGAAFVGGVYGTYREGEKVFGGG